MPQPAWSAPGQGAFSVAGQNAKAGRASRITSLERSANVTIADRAPLAWAAPCGQLRSAKLPTAPLKSVHSPPLLPVMDAPSHWHRRPCYSCTSSLNPLPSPLPSTGSLSPVSNSASTFSTPPLPHSTPPAIATEETVSCVEVQLYSVRHFTEHAQILAPFTRSVNHELDDKALADLMEFSSRKADYRMPYLICKNIEASVNVEVRHADCCGNLCRAFTQSGAVLLSRIAAC